MKIEFNRQIVDSNNVDIKDKIDRQELSVAKWRACKGKGILDIVPRFGKTRIGIIIASRYINYRPDNFVTIVTPNAQIKSQWLYEIDVYNSTYNSFATDRVFVITRYEFNNLDNINSNELYIYDEIHKYVTTDITYKRMLDRKDNFILGLTGTIPLGENLKKLLKIAPIIDTIEEEEAIKNNWISSYTEYNCAITFPYKLRNAYVKYSDFISEINKDFNKLAQIINSVEIYNSIYFGFKSDYDVITACIRGRTDITSGSYIKASEVRDIVAKIKGWNVQLNLHDSYDAQIEKHWSPDAIFNKVKTFLDFVNKRNSLIVENDIKIDSILKLLNMDKMKLETLIYVGSIDMAERLIERINNIAGKEIAISFHSKIPSKPLINPDTNEYFIYKSGSKKGLPKIFGKKKLKDFYVEQLKLGRYKILVTVESLNEGLNIPNLKQVITAAGSTNTITHKQRTARVKTIDENNLSKVGKIINLYLNDFEHKGEHVVSRDKTKLLQRQKYSNHIVQFMEEITI